MPTLPARLAHWSKYYQEYVDFITKHGRMSGAKADEMALSSTDVIEAVPWEGDNDVGDMLTDPSCAHIYRLHRLVAEGMLRVDVLGEGPSQVFYSLPANAS